MKKSIYTITGLLILILLLWQGCNFYSQYQSLLSQVSKFKVGEMAFETQRLKDSSTMATQGQLILTQKEAIAMGLIKNQELYKKVQSQVGIKTEIVIDTVFASYTPENFVDTTGWAYKYSKGDTSRSTLDSFIANSVIVPKKWEVGDKWYKLAGEVRKDGVMIDSVRIPNETSVTVAYRKSGFLNLGSKPVVDVTNTNPFMEVKSLKNVVIKPNKNIFSSKLFWTGLGIVGGLYLHSKL